MESGCKIEGIRVKIVLMGGGGAVGLRGEMKIPRKTVEKGG